MTTGQILWEAFAEIAKNADSNSHVIGATEIDYASFDLRSTGYDIDHDTFMVHTEFGCEGVYVGVFLERRNNDGSTSVTRVGTIKTLCEGRAAWQDMGMLAGELMYLANCVVNWRLYREEHQPTCKE